jgi:nucleoside phosphorylase
MSAKILLVDDDQRKVKNILLSIASVSGYFSEEIDVARTINEARKLLELNQYDLMILDLSLPERLDCDPHASGGVDLLTEIEERSIYNSPREVIGLTAYTSIKADHQNFFDKRLWSVMVYEESSEKWGEQLRQKLNQIKSSLSKKNVARHYDAEICVIAALSTPELKALLNIKSWNWSDYEVPDDPTNYYQGVLKNGKDIYAAASPRMGLPAAAVLASKMINKFRPKYLVMIGIAAGIESKVKKGDIIVADPGWDYGSGKITIDSEGASVFEPSPHQLNLDPIIKKQFEKIEKDHIALSSIYNEWPAQKPDTQLKVHIGPFASGASVIADPSVTIKLKDQHRKILGFDMESYGVMTSGHDSDEPKPKVIVIKSVCDYGDIHKDDEFQAYASYTSVALLKVWADTYL